MTAKNILNKLPIILKNLEIDYETNGTVEWSLYKSDPETHQKKVVTVKQEDFDGGTLRLLHPCKILFTESVSFNPNRPTTWRKSGGGITSDINEAVGIDPDRSKDWMPDGAFLHPSQEAPNAYRLGFFAGIAVECNDVIIDLNGFIFEQHKEHTLMQRFFAQIELADQPFLMGQGPAAFGEVLRSAKRVWIKNGMLGRSSHHNVHGNKCTDILFTDMVFKEAEVAAVSLNGAKRVAMIDCECKGNRSEMSVLGLFSSARFAEIFAKAMGAFATLPSDLDLACTSLKTGIEQIFNDVIFGLDNDKIGEINLASDVQNKAGQYGNPEFAIFKNEARLTDGPSYGIVFNINGVAVGPFAESRDYSLMETSEIALVRVSVENVKGHIVEIPALSQSNGEGNQTDMTGSIIQYLTDVSSYGVKNSDGTYQGTILSNLQFEMQKFKNTLTENLHRFSGLSIDINLLDWALGGGGKKLKLVPGENAAQLFDSNGTTPVSDAKYNIHYQGDAMHHVLKGMIGVRFEGACGVYMEDICVVGTENSGALGQFNVPYQGSGDGGHEGQASMIGYHGANVKGVSMAACQDVEIKNMLVSNTKSHFGNATGLNIMNDCANIKIDNVEIKDVTAGSELLNASQGYPNTRQLGQGLFVGPTCQANISNIKTGGVFKQPGPETAVSVKIESANVTIEN